jgi:hypothetical protein
MKYIALLLFMFTAIANSQAPAYGYIRGRVKLIDNFPVSSLPVYLNSDTVYTDEKGEFITLQKSGKVKIVFQSSIINIDLSANEIIDVEINSSPVGVVINNYSEDKMPSSALLDNDDITDIRFVNNSIWLPQCCNKSGSLTINHDNEFSVPYNSSAIYTIEKTTSLQNFNRKLTETRDIIIKDYSEIPETYISLRYLQDDTIWRTAIIKAKRNITNLPLNNYYIIKFNHQKRLTSKRLKVDLTNNNKETSFSNLQVLNTKSQKAFYQDTAGTYCNERLTTTINRVIFDDNTALYDNIPSQINYEYNTSMKLISDKKPTQYTRYKWMVYENNQWRLIESEWLYDKGELPSAVINKLTSGTKRDFMAYSTSNYIPEVWCANDVIIPYPDYSPLISMNISFHELPTLRGRVSINNGKLPPTSRLSITPVNIKPILKNLTPDIERELRLYNVNFDINTGDFNIILPGYGKYLLKFYTSDRSFPENEITIDKTEAKSCINFVLKQ